MNKSDLIHLVAERLHLNHSESERMVNIVLDSIKQGLQEKGRVTLTGFGSFDLRSRKKRDGRNPQTGESMSIPASRTVGFKPGKTWKEALQV
jgi:DNA-binding protein HU-beta